MSSKEIILILEFRNYKDTLNIAIQSGLLVQPWYIIFYLILSHFAIIFHLFDSAGIPNSANISKAL